MVIKLDMDNPSMIGLFDDPDYANITFANNSTFYGK
jgi:hypothetical protein